MLLKKIITKNQSKLIKFLIKKKLLNRQKFLEFREKVVASKLQLLTVIKKIKDKKINLWSWGAV